MKRGADQLHRLVSDAQWALARQLELRDLLPMLQKVIARARPGSPAALFAQRHLARLLVEQNPWRAARLARDVLRHEEDHEIWAVLALSYTLLGHYRCAKTAYYRALELAPACPAYSHNLGHLLDVALNRSHDALPHLARAHRALPEEGEIASSYAHALARAGQHEAARVVLARALGERSAAVQETLSAWLRADPPGSAAPPTAPDADADRGPRVAKNR